MTRPTILEINLAALHHNYERIRQYSPRAKILAMVKANAYGHGIKYIAPNLPGVDALGVACIEEAMAVRLLNDNVRIVLLEGIFSDNEMLIVAENRFELVLHDEWQIEALEKAKLMTPIPVWLKINTGMNRLGFQPQQVTSLIKRLQALPKTISKIHLMTHFSNADELENPKTQLQALTFNEATANLDFERSLANSAAILAWPETHADWVRPGIMLYGVAPFVTKVGPDFNLKPVMSLRSEIIAIHHLQKDDTVGYGGAWVSQTEATIGIIAVGYGDGYPRHAKNGTPVLVNQQQVPLVGRVSMDMIAVDLSSQPHVKIGDPVVLWGDGLPVEIVAQYANTIPYELLCNIAERIRRKITM